MFASIFCVDISNAYFDPLSALRVCFYAAAARITAMEGQADGGPGMYIKVPNMLG